MDYFGIQVIIEPQGNSKIKFNIDSQDYTINTRWFDIDYYDLNFRSETENGKLYDGVATKDMVNELLTEESLQYLDPLGNMKDIPFGFRF
ncbi:MAG: hypothetical protein KAI79_02210 [Bacteroidales bacterium]|nr:hypothetical protein [Bacteroidales bacterium]